MVSCNDNLIRAVESSTQQHILLGRWVLRLTACLYSAHRLPLRTGNIVTETGEEHTDTNKAVHNNFLYPTQPEWWEAFNKSHRLAYPAIEGKSLDGIACNIVIPALQPCQRSCHNRMIFDRSDIISRRCIRWWGLHNSTVIPRLTKIIRSGITFVSRNVISRRFV